MQLGMLWFDEDKDTTIEQKVERAITYYKEKYVKVPDVCFVHSAAIGKIKSCHGVELRPNDTIQKNHFWIGIDNDENDPRATSQAQNNA